MEMATFAKLAKAYNGEDESLGNLLDEEFYSIVIAVFSEARSLMAE